MAESVSDHVRFRELQQTRAFGSNQFYVLQTINRCATRQLESCDISVGSVRAVFPELFSLDVFVIICR